MKSKKTPRLSVPVPHPVTARLDRLAGAGLHGVMSRAYVAGMALQVGVTLLENIYLQQPLPESLEPLGEKLRHRGRPPERKKKPLPYGATLVADAPPGVPAFSDLIAPSPNTGPYEIDPDWRPPTDSDRPAPPDAPALTPAVSRQLDSGHQAWETRQAVTVHDRPDGMLGDGTIRFGDGSPLTAEPGEEPKSFEDRAQETINSLVVGAATTPSELEARRERLAFALPEPPSLPIGVMADDITTAATPEQKKAMQHYFDSPPIEPTGEHFTLATQHHASELEPPATPVATGTKLVRFEQPTEPVGEVFHDDGTVSVVDEPTNVDPASVVDDPADLDPPPPPKTDPMTCPHGVRHDAKLPCAICNPFG